mmetsp:Transcript_44574/g.117867  ORF Transcript_44574/g.117867 Transcript_44574/m.117867 type:complete len:253 (-) Transcript_44574:50-808(-)
MKASPSNFRVDISTKQKKSLGSARWSVWNPQELMYVGDSGCTARLRISGGRSSRPSTATCTSADTSISPKAEDFPLNASCNPLMRAWTSPTLPCTHVLLPRGTCPPCNRIVPGAPLGAGISTFTSSLIKSTRPTATCRSSATYMRTALPPYASGSNSRSRFTCALHMDLALGGWNGVQVLHFLPSGVWHPPGHMTVSLPWFIMLDTVTIGLCLQCRKSSSVSSMGFAQSSSQPSPGGSAPYLPTETWARDVL